MEIIPDKRKVVGLVAHAYDGTICLPNFQRDFVWTREEVADLVRSIIRGYFIGSLLLLRSDPNDPPFAPEFLRGAQPQYKDPRPELFGPRRSAKAVLADVRAHGARPVSEALQPAPLVFRQPRRPP